MMKFLIATVTIFVLGGIAVSVSAVNDACELQCTATGATYGNYTGGSSVVTHLTANTKLVYCIKVKVYAVIDIIHDSAWLMNGKFIIILNMVTGVYLVLDLNTQLGTHEQVKVAFLTSTNEIDYDKLVIQGRELLDERKPITNTTKDSFDWLGIMNAFYNGNFNLESILTSKELITVLETNYASCIKLLKTQIEAGNILAGCGYWGFLIVHFDLDIDDARALVEFLRVSLIYYGSIELEYLTYVINIAVTDFAAYRKIIAKSTAITTLLGKNDLKLFLDYLENPKYNEIVYHITENAKINHSFNVYRINTSYLLINVHYCISYINGVLLIDNWKTNTLLAIKGSSAVVTNKTSGLAFVIDIADDLAVKVSTCDNATFIRLAREQNGFEVSKQVLIYIKENSVSGHRCNLKAFIETVIKGDVKLVGNSIGSSKLAAKFITSFKVFLSAVKTKAIGKLSLSAFVLGEFGIDAKLKVVKSLVQLLSRFSRGSEISSFYENLLKLIGTAKRD